MKGDQYQCAKCGDIFTRTTPVEKMMKEYHRDFPGVSDEEREIVCHDCWKMMTRKIPPPGFR